VNVVEVPSGAIIAVRFPRSSKRCRRTEPSGPVIVSGRCKALYVVEAWRPSGYAIVRRLPDS
jgi:hypothetical protein